MIGYMYILKCNNDSCFTGSIIDLEKLLKEHDDRLGLNHTKKYLPVEFVYYEVFQRIDKSFPS